MRALRLTDIPCFWTSNEGKEHGHSSWKHSALCSNLFHGRNTSDVTKLSRNTVKSITSFKLRRKTNLSCDLNAESFWPNDKLFGKYSSEDIFQIPETAKECSHLLRNLVIETKESGTLSGSNIVAFSGGVDSSLAAYLVKAAFPENHNTFACIGVSPALPSSQLFTAREVAEYIGVRLFEVKTGEGNVPEYVANEGSSCYFCKTTLYSTLTSVAKSLSENQAIVTNTSDLVLFNGTNADDLKDPTRLGLLAALNFNVASPLASLPKAAVRALAHYTGLPNWNLAAAPCLRSRLDFGVKATEEALFAVGFAEEKVRKTLKLGTTDNMRVRVLPGKNAWVEVDEWNLVFAQEKFEELRVGLMSVGLKLDSVRSFKSGSLSLNLKTKR